MKYLALLLLLLCAMPVTQAAVKFPDKDDLREFRTTCGAGKLESIESASDTERAERLVGERLEEVKASSTARSNLSSVRRDMAAVMEKVTPDANGNVFYVEYLGCILRLVDTFLVSKNLPHSPVNPGGDVDGFVSAGVAYGSVRTDSGQGITNDNQLIWVARVGWWLNDHLAFGLEGNYWHTRTNTLNSNGELIQTGQPLRQMAATAILPIYVHFGRRFPLVLCAGAGMGWESYDYLLLDSKTGTQGRLTNRDSGLALMAGAGFEFAWTPHTTLSVLARGTRTTIDSLSSTEPGTDNTKARLVVYSLGLALSFH